MTSQGGSGGTGVIFEWDPSTNVYTKKIDLTGTNGKYPFGDLILYGNKFYGMTYQGGINNAGVIFDWDPATNVYSKKVDLSCTNGSNQYGNLMLYTNKFYGLTNTGGTNSDGGVIFEWDPVTNIYTRKYSFTMYGDNGSRPYGTLTMNGGKFYGVPYHGGGASGVLFEWTPQLMHILKRRISVGPVLHTRFILNCFRFLLRFLLVTWATAFPYLPLL